MTERITSRQNPLMGRLRKLGADRSFRRAESVFLCEGVKLVEEAVKWNADIETVVQADEFTPPFALPETVRRVSVPEDLLRAVSTQNTPQGILCVCRMPRLEGPVGTLQGRCLVLDGVQDPGNVGTIWRTADAFGAAGLFLTENCADPFSPKTVRATMGACFRLPVWEMEPEELGALFVREKIPLYATALREDTADVRQVDLSCAAVVIGSEGKGISPRMLALCSKTLKIPMTGRCESLNAAAAASVVLWEGARAEL